MPVWLDENTIEGELSYDEFCEKVRETMLARIDKERQLGRPLEYGNDGLVTLYEESQSHNGVKYMLKVLGYFAVYRGGAFPLRAGWRTGCRGMNDLGKYVVVERDSVELDWNLKELLGLNEFLFHDTLHSGMEDWSLRRQWEWAEQRAKEDCERVDQLETEFNKKVTQVKRELRKFLKTIKQ